MTAHLSSFRAAFAVANTQANAREIEAVAKVERLTEEMGQALADELNATQAADRMTDEVMGLTAELTALRAHAAALEALLTVDLGDGPVKLWESVEIQANLSPWEVAKFVPSITWGAGLYAAPLIKGMSNCLSPSRRIRQTPAPEPELKRWRVRYKGPGVFMGDDTVIIEATRAQAEAFGEVIGEA
jgi:hypothetical protein